MQKNRLYLIVSNFSTPRSRHVFKKYFVQGQLARDCYHKYKLKKNHLDKNTVTFTIMALCSRVFARCNYVSTNLLKLRSTIPAGYQLHRTIYLSKQLQGKLISMSLLLQHLTLCYLEQIDFLPNSMNGSMLKVGSEQSESLITHRVHSAMLFTLNYQTQIQS